LSKRSVEFTRHAHRLLSANHRIPADFRSRSLLFWRRLAT